MTRRLSALTVEQQEEVRLIVREELAAIEAELRAKYQPRPAKPGTPRYLMERIDALKAERPGAGLDELMDAVNIIRDARAALRERA